MGESMLTATGVLIVKNRPAFFPSLVLNPSTVPMGGQTTLAGTYTDPGELDSHLLDVDLSADGVYEFIGFHVAGGTVTFNIPVTLPPGTYDVNVRILSDVALIHARATYTMLADGVEQEALYTDTYQKRDGIWFCVAACAIAPGA